MKIPWISLFVEKPVGERREFVYLRRQGIPFLYFDRNKESALQALESYPAQSFAARIFRITVRGAIASGLGWGLPRIWASIPARSSFGDFLISCSGERGIPAFSVLCGNPRTRGRRFIFTLLRGKRVPEIVVKAGFSSRARELILKEIVFLESAALHVSGIPKVLNKLDDGHVAAFASEHLAGHAARGFDAAKLSVLMDSLIRGASRRPVKDFPEWKEMEAVQNPLFRRAGRCLADAHVVPVVSHGDLVPWNIKVDPQNKWSALDWENGSMEGIPGWDWYHYYVQTSVLVFRESARETFSRIRELILAPEFQRYAAATGIAGFEVPLFAACLSRIESRQQADRYQSIRALIRNFDAEFPGWDQQGASMAEPGPQGSPDTFSIVTPCYNQLDWLRLCVASVRDQVDVASNEMRNVECGMRNAESEIQNSKSKIPTLAVEHIIQDAGTPGIDDFAREVGGDFYRDGKLVFRGEYGACGMRNAELSGSSEHPKSKIQNPESLPTYRIVIFSERDTGMYDAINRGVWRASGQIIAWLNSDEQYLPGTLEKAARFFDGQPEKDVLFGDALLLDEGGNILSYRRAILPHRRHIMLAHLNTLSCATFVRRRVFDRGFVLDASCKAIADALWVVDMLVARVKMGVMSEPLSAFTITTSNLGQSALAFTEAMLWRKKLSAFERSFRMPIIFLHRLRKFFAGAYGYKSIQTALFTQSSSGVRVATAVPSIPFTWPQAEQEHALHEQTTGTAFFLKSYLLAGILFPLIFSLFAQWLERFVPGMAIAPFLYVVFLLGIAFYSSPFNVVLAGGIFSISVYISFVAHMNAMPGSGLGGGYVMVRMASFFLACGAAFFFGVFRRKARLAEERTVQVLENIPVPLFISDATGLISFANKPGRELFGDMDCQFGSEKWSSLMMADTDEGSATRKYVQYFSKASVEPFAVSLTLATNRRQTTFASLLCLGSGDKKIMLTVLDAASSEFSSTARVS